MLIKVRKKSRNPNLFSEIQSWIFFLPVDWQNNLRNQSFCNSPISLVYTKFITVSKTMFYCLSSEGGTPNIFKYAL